MSRDVLTDLGYAWPPGELVQAGLCSIGGNGETGIVAYRVSATPEGVEAFYDAEAERIPIGEAMAVGHSIVVDGEQLGLDAPSTAWRLADDAVIIATPDGSRVRLVARFANAEPLDCDDAYEPPAEDGARPAIHD